MMKGQSIHQGTNPQMFIPPTRHGKKDKQKIINNKKEKAWVID